MLELARGASAPITLAGGEQRSFLQDGDSVSLRGRCSRDGFRSIGFGDCEGTILPARSLTAARG
jgi:fumarylacetoacetase